MVQLMPLHASQNPIILNTSSVEAGLPHNLKWIISDSMAYSFQKFSKTIQKFTYNFNKYYNKKTK